jgi:hypothetical protein
MLNRRKANIIRNEVKIEGQQAIVTDSAGHMVTKTATNLQDLIDTEPTSTNSTNGSAFYNEETYHADDVYYGTYPYRHQKNGHPQYDRSPTMVTVYITGMSGKQLRRFPGNALGFDTTWDPVARWNLIDDGDCLYGDGNCIAIQSAANPENVAANYYLEYDGADANAILALSLQTESWRLEHQPGGKIRFRDSEDNYMQDVDGTLGMSTTCSSTYCDFKVEIIGVAWGNAPHPAKSMARIAVCVTRLDHENFHMQLQDTGLSFVAGQCDSTASFTMEPAATQTGESHFATNGQHIRVANGSIVLAHNETHATGWRHAHPEDNLMTFRTDAHEYLEERPDDKVIFVNDHPDMRNQRKWEVRLMNITFCHMCPHD